MLTREQIDKALSPDHDQQHRAIIKKFCNRCCYFWTSVGCEYQGNNTGDIIAECSYFREIKPLSEAE